MSDKARGFAREFWINESRCTGKKRAHKSEMEAWDEMQPNDNTIHVVEMSALMAESEAHKQIAAQLAQAKEREARLVECLEFYAVNWRCDVYVGPRKELLDDQGDMARKLLAEIRGDGSD